MFVIFCLFWKKNYRLVAADLNKQKALNADLRAIQQIIFTGEAGSNAMVYYSWNVWIQLKKLNTAVKNKQGQFWEWVYKYLMEMI